MLSHCVIMQAPAAGPESGGGGSPSAPAKAVAASADVLDREALERLRELDPTGKSGLLERVAEAFGTSTARLLPQMRSAGQAGDLEGVRYTSHTFKSSSASLGALRLSQLCAELELQARAGDSTDLEARVEEIAAEIEIVLQALKVLTGSGE